MTDIAQYADLKASTARKLIQLMGVISGIAPMKPNADSLSQEVGVSKNNIPDYLVYLEKAGMIGQLRDNTGGLRGLGKVDRERQNRDCGTEINSIGYKRKSIHSEKKCIFVQLDNL